MRPCYESTEVLAGLASYAAGKVASMRPCYESTEVYENREGLIVGAIMLQ